MDRAYTIKRAAPADCGILAALAVRLFTSSEAAELEAEFAALTESEDAACFLDYADGQAVGFAQCNLRHDYVEGTHSSPVGYLEGIFILPGYRNRGYAAALLSACEGWAREKGCTEFASDCELSDILSSRFHTKAGFKVANRIIHFTKKLD